MRTEELYVPICLFRVNFEIASGRPFTDLERVILDALTERSAKVSELAELFFMRLPIIIESLVTLAREGWVALDSNTGKYVVTSAGKLAVTDVKKPQFLKIEERQMVILMERVGGGLIRGSEARFLTWRDFPGEAKEPPTDRVLDIEWLHTRLSGGQIDRFIKADYGNWIHRVHAPQLSGVGGQWIKAQVDIESGHVRLDGITPNGNRLVEALRNKAETITGRRLPPQDHRALQSVDTEACRWYDVCVEAEDLWRTKDRHADALVRALNEAQTFVHVASAFFDPSSLQNVVRQALLSALQRGVKVGMLWGYEQGERARETIDWLSKVHYDAGPNKHGFWYNSIASDSHAKILAWDSNDEPNVVVGSCNWLTSPVSVNEHTRENLSVRVGQTEIVVELLRSLAGLWLQVGRQAWYPAAEHLFDYAGRLAGRLAVSGTSNSKQPNARVRMVCDHDHEREMRDLLLAASRRCWVASHKLGDNALSRLAPLGHSGRPVDLETRVTYEQLSHDEAPLSRARDLIDELGGSLHARERFHAKCVVSDDFAFVSSFNFLSAGPFGSGKTAREVGLVFDCQIFADVLWDWSAPV